MTAINHLFPQRLRRRSSAKAFHRSAAVALMLAICAVAATEPANAQSQTIDLSSQPIGAPPQDFEFWRAGEAEPDYWTVVHDAASDSSVSIQRSGRDRNLHSSLAVCKTLSPVKARIRVRFKLVDGSMPSAGIAVRVTIGMTIISCVSAHSNCACRYFMSSMEWRKRLPGSTPISR